MAESKEFQLRKSLLDAYGKLQSDRRLNKTSRSDVSPQYIEAAYSEIHKHVVNDISSQDAQELLDPNSEYRYGIAMQALEKMAAKGAEQSYQGSQEHGHTQGDTAKATLEMLQNRDKYGLLDGKTEEDVLEVAWFTTGTANALSPEEVEKKALEKKKVERKAYLEERVKNKKALDMQYQVDAAKIDAKGLSEKEMRDARREATIEYLQNKLQDETWATRTSNSVGDLYGAESFLIGATSLGADKTLSAEDKEKIAKGFEDLGSKSTAMGVLMRAQKGAQFFRDPSGYLASKAGGAVTKFAAKQASKWAVKAALAVGLNAVAPVVGQLAAELVSRIVGPLIENVIKANIDRARRAIKTIAAAATGFALFLGGAMGAGAVVAAASTGAIIIILVPVVFFFLFIINAGGYVVPAPNGIQTAGSITDVCGNANQGEPTSNPGNCFMPKGFVSCGSYGRPGAACPATCAGISEKSGHGGNCYWSVNNACNYGLPTIDTNPGPQPSNITVDKPRECTTSPFPANTCYNPASKCDWYGYATDFTYGNLRQLDSSNCLPVYLPTIEGQSVTWETAGFTTGDQAEGAHGILKAVVNGKRYDMYMEHLNAPPSGGQSGQVAGTLYEGFHKPGRDGRHVHIEMRVNGQYVRPDDYFCN